MFKSVARAVGHFLLVLLAWVLLSQNTVLLI